MAVPRPHPNTKAILLRQVKRKMFGRSDHELLSMFEEVKDSIKGELALSAYWGFTRFHHCAPIAAYPGVLVQ